MFGPIIAADVAIIDKTYDYTGFSDGDAAFAPLSALLDRLGLKPGDKYKPTTWNGFKEFLRATQSLTPVVSPGGSTANVLRTLGKIAGGDIQEIGFLTYISPEEHSESLKRAFRESGIRLLEPAGIPDSRWLRIVRQIFSYSSESPSRATQSLVILPPGENPDRIIATRVGTGVREALTPASIPDGKIEGAAAILMQGSMMQKLGADFFNAVLSRRQPETEVWLGLPTDTKFTSANVPYFQHLALDVATVVSADVKEFQATFPEGSLRDGLERLSASWRRGASSVAAKWGKEKVALITNGGDTAYLVSQLGGIEEIQPRKVQALYTIGAGDATFAAFLAAVRIAGFRPHEAAKIAMQAGAAKVLQREGACLTDPRHSLAQLAEEGLQLVRRLNTPTPRHALAGRAPQDRSRQATA